jgi:uncharacterized protein (DUF2236 family)
MPTLPLPSLPLIDVRRVVGRSLEAMFSSDRFPGEQYAEPLGDPGLFGPSSVTWRIHADISMLVGGISALMLQALHPLAAAGVVEHSRYREEPLRRLSRTASFIAATTYGSTEAAERVIAMVRAVHRRVEGVAPDGRAYSASDPELLRWVHVAEVVSFLRAHRRFDPFPVRGADIDRYFAETATVAELLGATEVPRTRRQVRDYLTGMRTELRADAQAQDLVAFLRQPIAHDPITRSTHMVLVQAAVGLLPGWARGLYGVHQPPGFDSLVVRPATWSVIQALRLVLGPSPLLEQARRRAGAQPVALAS